MLPVGISIPLKSDKTTESTTEYYNMRIALGLESA